MNNARSIWEAYAAAWKASGPESKRTALATSVCADAVYRDPLVECPGHDSLIAYMLDFHRQVPGGHFQTTWFMAHHDRCVARWNMMDGNGTCIGEGTSFGEFSGNGRLRSMTGFFEIPPAP